MDGIPAVALKIVADFLEEVTHLRPDSGGGIDYSRELEFPWGPIFLMQPRGLMPSK